MNTTDKFRFILYRCHEKGLEILMINPDLQNDKEVWRLPAGYLEADALDGGIKLEDYVDESGESYKTIAVEADWHHIPSIRGIIKHDVKRLKSKIKQKVTTLENCSYLSVKEVMKKTLPYEYRVLKELKDIIIDKNQASLI